MRCVQNVGTHCAGVLQHCVSEAAVSLGLELQVVVALEDHGFLQVAGLLVLVAHRVLAVVGDGLGGLFGEQADESHLDCDRVGRLILVAVRELEKKKKSNGGGQSRRSREKKKQTKKKTSGHQSSELSHVFPC